MINLYMQYIYMYRIVYFSRRP